MKKSKKTALIITILIIGLICTGLYFTGFSLEPLRRLVAKAPTEEELLSSIPEMDSNAYNRFLFSVKIDVGNESGDGKDFKGTGAVELYQNISHMYNADFLFSVSGYQTKAESWSNFDTSEIYKDLGEGWVTSHVRTPDPIGMLRDVINNRDNDRILTMDSSTCTLSWKFDTDIDYLFSTIMSHYTDNLDLTGYGRATAVFDPSTYEFQYLTVIISANNSDQAGALLDSVFQWEAQNDTDKVLSIPETISSEVYQKETGITMTGGYDETVNPIAEDLIEAYSGTAETVKNSSEASLFWTVSDAGISSTVNYLKTGDPSQKYEESLTTLTSVYGEPVESEDSSACFYRAKTGELVYIAKTDDSYGEIIITGSESSQAELRKSLVTYRAKLGL